MKIIRNNICYIELDDIKFLGNIPMNIFFELKMSYKKGYKFQKFVQKEAINFFAQRPYIINYDSICDLSIDELDETINEFKLAISNLSLNCSEKDNSTDKKSNIIDSLKYMLQTLENYRNNKFNYDKLINEIFKQKQKRL